MSEIPQDLHNKSNFKQSSVPPKTGMKDMLKNPVYSKNRVYDRKSGTGRGKEISKNGAGGKYTWDGQGQIEQDLEDEEYVHKEPGDIKKEFY